MHEHVVAVEPKENRPTTQSYLIDGKYCAFSGAIYLAFESRSSHAKSVISVYGDDTLLDTSPEITTGVRVIPFSIDVGGVTVLKISATVTYSAYHQTICIGDCLLQP